MEQKLLTDIELDVHELKYLMDSFSKEPTQTLSELLKRSILRMRERLEQLSEEVDTVQIASSSVSIVEDLVAPLEEQQEIPVVEIAPAVIIEEFKAPVVEDDFLVTGGENLFVIEEPVTKVEKESVDIEDMCEAVDNNESLVVTQEIQASVLGESIKLSLGLRQSISLNDSFRFAREMFGGDSELMNRVVEQISVMNSYRMAVAFLSSKVCVSQENEATNDFLELLKKYFNQSA